jgi:hypothetical protein
LYQPAANVLRDEVLVDFATSVEAKRRPTTPARARAIADTRKIMATKSPFEKYKNTKETTDPSAKRRSSTCFANRRYRRRHRAQHTHHRRNKDDGKKSGD